MRVGNQRRIGVLGGTFNPVHLGHLILAQTAAETHDLEEVLFVPCSIPPHKRGSGLCPAEYRVGMLEAALEGDLCFELSDVEMQRGGVSFAVDTVAELCRRYPDRQIFFIIGADTLPELHTWRNIYDLLTLCTFVTFARPGFNLDSIRRRGLHLDSPWEERLLANVTSSRQIDISSSDIRHRVAEGMSIRYLVPSAVEMYIAEHGLYGK